MTNAGGFVTHAATFEPYGSLLEDSGTGSSLGFTGEMHDSTGLVYLRARYADPITGTFLTRDPVIGVSGFSQTWNPYSYVRNNPINGTDPSGKFFPLLFAIAAAAVIGAAIGGAINVATQLSENGGRLDCIDKEELGMAMLEGFIMGAVSGLTGGLTSAAGLTGLAAAIPMAIVDFGAGVIWDKLVRNVSDEEAITNGITNIAFGAAVDALSKPFAKMLSKAARMIKDKVADTRLGRGLGSAMSNFADSRVGRWLGMGAEGAENVCMRNSFSEDTPVLTEEGDRPISEIEVGDEVLAYNEATGETGEYEVTATMYHLDPEIVLLTIDGETIETTPEHPFYTVEGEWVDAADLEAGYQIRNYEGEYGTVESIEIIIAEQGMYNLTVDEAHTFFVGEGEWLVHNVDCKKAAIEAAQAHRAKYGLKKGASSGIVDSDGITARTGNSANTGSGKNVPAQLKKKLRQVNEVDPHVCAEVDACGQLLEDMAYNGETIEDIKGNYTIATISNVTGEVIEPCANCTEWVYEVFGDDNVVKEP